MTVSILSTILFCVSALAQVPSDTARAVQEVKNNGTTPSAWGVELPYERSFNSKTYMNTAASTMTTVVSGGYVHYRDRSGRFHEIDRSVALKADSTGFQVRKGLYTVEFPFHLADADRPVRFQTLDDDYFVSQMTALAYFDRQTKQVVSIQDAQASEAVTDGNRIRYMDVFDGVDVEYVYLDTKLKQFVYISQNARDGLPDPGTYGLKSNRTELVVVSRFAFPDVLEAFANDAKVSSKEDEKKAKLTYEGEEAVAFRTKQGKMKFALQKDVAYMQAGADSSTIGDDSHKKMWRRFFAKGEENFMITGVSLNWLYKQSRGTVVLDPTIAITPPTDDVWLENSSNKNAYDFIIVAKHSSFPKKRTPIKFDLSGVDLPSGTEIDKAEMKLYFYYASKVGGTSPTWVDRPVSANKLLVSWSESQATRDNRLTGTAWQAQYGALDGTDGASSGEDTVTITNNWPRWETWDLTDLTQDWLDGTATNYGVMMWATNEDTDSRDIRFRASEYTSDVTQRPRLEITYTLDPLMEYVYDVESRIDSVYYGGSEAVEDNTYDANRGWITKREYKAGATNLFYFENTVYDDVGNLERQEFKHNNDTEERMDYDYDDLYRLTDFEYRDNSADASPDLTRSYDYDDNGNLTTFPGKTMTYGNDNNQLTNDGSSSYTFDDAGRAEQIGGTTVGYDIFSNMTDHGSYDYYYDAFNQRTKKVEGSSTTYYVTSGAQILAEYDNNGELLAEYVYDDRGIVTKYNLSEGHRWFFKDHLGSTRQVNDDELKQDYLPYGDEKNAAGDETAFRFSAKELDNGTDLYYFGARYYDQKLGRWYAPDPAGQGFSPYVYCGNRPLIMVDPTGEWFWVAIGALVGTWFGGAATNDWDLNPGNWDWSDPSTYFGMGVGALAGGGLGYLSEIGKLPFQLGLSFNEQTVFSVTNFGAGHVEGALLGTTIFGAAAVTTGFTITYGPEYGGNLAEGSWSFLNELAPSGFCPTGSSMDIASLPWNPRYGHYGWTRNGGLGAHRGVDLNGEFGSPVYAYLGGTVQTPPSIAFGPYWVQIKSVIGGETYYQDYGHLSGRNVGPGDVVSMGDIIGYMGNHGIPGYVSTPHVHFAIWKYVHGKKGYMKPRFAYFDWLSLIKF